MNDQNDETVLMSRRTWMTTGLALVALPALAATTETQTSASSLMREAGIPTDPRQRISIMRRMRLRTNPGVVFWWFRGRNYAQQGATLTPMCELIFGAMMKVKPRSDGGLDVVQYELGFRTALDSNERAEKLRNPLTGEMIAVPFAPVGPTVTHYSPENVLQLPPSIGGTTITLEHVPELFYRMGDMVCVQTHSRARAQTPGATDRVLNDMSMICSPASQALDPNRANASAWAHGTDVTDYARWLKMPPGIGTQTLRSVGQKVNRYGDMPPDWRAMVAKEDPKMAADPLSVLDREQAIYRN